MRLIYTDSQHLDAGLVLNATATHEESADVNLLTLSVPLEDARKYTSGCYVYDDDNREFGGRISRYDSIDTFQNTAVLGGYTWRGILATRIVCPPNGQDYLYFSSASNITTSSIVIELLNLCGLASIFEVVPTTDIGAHLQCDRYSTLLSVLDKLYQNVGCCLKLEFNPISRKIKICGKIPEDYSGEYDTINTDLHISYNMLPVTHLICLGSGELSNRTVEHLYLQADGSIGFVEYYNGISKNEKVFDCPNAESAEQLVENGKAHFKELLSATTTADMAVNEAENLNLGDIVGSCESVTGIVLTQKITRKVVTVSVGADRDDVNVTKSYETGEL